MNRIRVRINHHPVSYRCIELFSGVFAVFLIPMFAVPLQLTGVLIGSIVLNILIFAAGEFCSSINGFLSADDEMLRFRYIKYEDNILLSEITEISYGVYTEYAGILSTKRISLTVKTADGKEHTFNDKINEEELAAAFDETGKKDVPIVRMYKFLAHKIPDRAKGYIKPETLF